MSFEIHPKKRVPVKLTTPLANAFGFDFGDLQDNRMGFISNWQRGRLRWYLLNYTYSLLIWLFGIALSGAMLTMFISGLFSLSIEFVFSVSLVLGIALLLVAVALWAYKLGAVIGDMRFGKVAQLNNVVRHHREYRLKSRSLVNDGKEGYREIDYYLKIGQERFPVLKEQMDAFIDGVEYTVFITPNSRQILSAELLRTDDLDEFEQEIFYGAEKTKYQMNEA